MDIEKKIPITTGRLLLDRFYMEDWRNLNKIEQSHEQHRFNFETYNPRTEEQIKDYVIKLNKQNYNEYILPFLFAIRLKKDGQMIGFIGFKKGKLIEKGVTEVYYSIYKNFWNNGFGTEALKGMLRFGFDELKLHRIFAGCDIDNVASKKILEKSGMQFESRWRKDRIRNGKWKDGLGFAILEEDCV